MEDKTKAFLASGKLEEYLYGILEENDQREVESFIKKYPEVKREYQILQDQLESISMQQAMKAPTGLKSQIMESLPDKKTPSSNLSWSSYIALAGIVASILLAWAWNQSQSDLKKATENYVQLASDCEQREKQMEAQSQQIAFFNSQQTQRFEMQGNRLAPDFKAIVFVNEAVGKTIITPTQKLSLPQNKCLQLWGDLDGKMIPIAVLNDIGTEAYDLDIDPNFTSLNLTIEDKTQDGKGQLHPDVSQLIASVLI